MTQILDRGERRDGTDSPIIGWLEVIAKAAALGLITDAETDTRATFAPYEPPR